VCVCVYIYIYLCVCLSACERETEKNSKPLDIQCDLLIIVFKFWGDDMVSYGLLYNFSKKGRGRSVLEYT
jgi:hypothetical protein